MHANTPSKKEAWRFPPPPQPPPPPPKKKDTHMTMSLLLFAQA